MLGQPSLFRILFGFRGQKLATTSFGIDTLTADVLGLYLQEFANCTGLYATQLRIRLANVLKRLRKNLMRNCSRLCSGNGTETHRVDCVQYGSPKNYLFILADVKRGYKRFRCCRGTARRSVSVEILSTAANL